MSDILDLDAIDLSERYRTGDLSPREVVRALFSRIDMLDPTIGAFCRLEPATAETEAALSEERWRRGEPKGRLDGVPFTIKDNLAWAGRPTRRGSKTTGADPAPENAPAVDRLLEAGAIPVGKTTLPEFAWKGLGDSPLYGTARNPWDTRMTPGGSSAGAGAAAALNLCPIHLGTDGAGSIRIPASFCGVFGIKPSFGRVPAFPPSPFAIVSHVGPMTRTVRDAAAMLDVIAVPDPRDIMALPLASGSVSGDIDRPLEGVTIAWSPRLGHVERLDPEVEALTAAAARAFEQLGAVVEAVDPPLGETLGILHSLWSTGAWAVLSTLPEARWSEIDPGFVALATSGRSVSAPDFLAAGQCPRPAFSRHGRFPPALSSAADPNGRHAGLRDGSRHAAGRDVPGWLARLDAVQLPLQPHATTGRERALWADEGRPSCRPANCRTDAC
jgi:aspartyl-tRNA(Asn)/glutamyl-tRNA(Gln) amidotransferase subunit A